MTDVRSVGPESAVPLLQADQRVDHFRVVRQLGRGGFGEVYLARDTRLGRRVALKIVHPRHLGSQEAVQRFLFEARATAHFSHPHIVTVYAVGEHEGMPYVALEYLEGRTLRERLRDERPTQAETLRIALAIAEALTEAHAGQILHRDLKPENILLAKDGRLRVLDFGLAKKIGAGEVERPAAPSAFTEATAPTEVMPRLAHFDDPPSADSDALRDGASAGSQALGPTLPPVATSSPASVQPLLMDGDASQTLGTGFDSSALSGVRGTPHYMAPEQWSAAPQTSAVDLWAFGVLLHELLTGVFPYRAKQPLAIGHEVCGPVPLTLALDGAELPRELRELVVACLDKDPAARPSAARAVEILRELLTSGRAELVEEQGPFRGLLPFGERHAGLYFGREAELAAFLELTRDEPTLAVVGPSGAGKSSFVAAGVVPRLREQGRTLLLRLRPGADPFGALASRLRGGEQLSGHVSRDSVASQELRPASAADETAALAAELRATPERLGLLLRQLADEQQARVVLFVDQLEELYTQSPAAQRQRFMQALASASDDAQEPVRTIVTLRDDFLGRVAEGEAARRLLARIVVLRSPDRAALAAILQRSLAAFGYRYEDERIVGEMVTAIGDEPAALPLLSFAGRMLWERRDRERRLLPRAAYEQMGGVAGALATHADAVVQGLSVEQQSIARALLLRLTTAEGTRRALARSALLEGLGEDATLVLSRLTEARLLTVRQGGATGGAEHELAHETLISSWGRLARWLDESREERAFLAEIEQAAQLWERRGRRRDEVWTGDALDEARRWLARCEAVPEFVVTFVEAGEVLARERALAARRRRGVVRGAIVGASLALVALTAVWAVALRSQAHKAAVARDDAIQQLARAHSEGATLALRQGEPQRARAMLRSALEAGLSRGALPTTVAQQLRLTAWQLDLEPLVWEHKVGSHGLDLAFSPDGRKLLVAARSALLFDVASGTVRRLREEASKTSAVAFSTDGQTLALGDQQGRVALRALGGAERWLSLGQRGEINELIFSSRELFVATNAGLTRWPLRGSELGRHVDLRWVRGLQVRGGELAFFSGLERLRHHRGETTVTVDQERQVHGRVVAYGRAIVAGDTMIYGFGLPSVDLVLRRASGERRRLALPAQVRALAYEPRRRLLAVGGGNGQVTLWNARGPQFLVSTQMTDTRDLRHMIRRVRFSPDGSLLAGLTSSGKLMLWRVAPLLLKQRAGHDGSVRSVALRPDGRLAASVAVDNTLRFWSTTTGRQREVRDLDTEAQMLVYGPATRLAGPAGPAGALLASAGGQGIDLWDGATGRHLQRLEGHRGPVLGIAFDRSGRRLASVSKDRTVRIWQLGKDETAMRVIRLRAIPTAVAWRADGRALAVGFMSRRELVAEVDVEGRRPLRPLLRRPEPKRWRVEAVRWLASGRLLTRVVGGELFADDRLVAKSYVFGGPGQLTSDHDGTNYYGVRIGAHAFGGTLGLSRLSDDSLVRTFPLHRRSVTAADDVDGRVVTGADDGGVRVWAPGAGVPRGFTPLFLPNPPRLVGAAGVRALDSGELGPLHLGWQRAAATALRAHVSGDGATLCLLDTEHRLELWDLPADRRRLRRSLGPWLARERRRPQHVTSLQIPVRLAAMPGGCLVLGGQGLELHRPKLPIVRLCRECVLGPGPRVVFADQAGVFALDARGKPRLVQSIAQASAVIDMGELRGVMIDARLTIYRPLSTAGVPHRQGAVEPIVQLSPDASLLLSGVAGPASTVFLGTQGGSLSVFLLESGRLLHRFKLHGPLKHLWRGSGRIVAATELGDHRSIDVAALELPACALLRRIWQRMPLIWQDGSMVPRPPPSRHPCRQAVAGGNAQSQPAEP